MTVIDQLTPVYYRLVQMRIVRDGADVKAIGYMEILNANGSRIGADFPATTLTAGEKTALQAFLTRELGVYETATGLTEWTS
jgi:hypothetical protein